MGDGGRGEAPGPRAHPFLCSIFSCAVPRISFVLGGDRQPAAGLHPDDFRVLELASPSVSATVALALGGR